MPKKKLIDNSEFKEKWEQFLNNLSNKMSDKFHLDVQLNTGTVQTFVGEDGKIDWPSVMAATTVDEGDSKVRILGATQINILDGDTISFIDEDLLKGEDKEMFNRVLKMLDEAAGTGLDLRQQWADYAQRLIVMAIKLGAI